MPPYIKVNQLGKRFKQRDRNRARTVQELITSGWRKRQKQEWFWALRDIDLTVQAGEMVGLIGHNGAGKSTLLRLAGGIGRVDEGTVETSGRIGALLELGAGFHPDLTGRENVYINGVISGLTRAEVAACFDDIVAFAELAEFIEQPLRTYSTGMQMRLAFAIAVHIDPEILLIDEVLAVGDAAFEQKCLAQIEQFKNKGCAVLLVSHNTQMVAQMCDRVLWLDHGRIRMEGPAAAVVESYMTHMHSETRQRTPQQAVSHNPNKALQLHHNRFGSLEVEIVDVQLHDGSQQPVTAIRSGSPLFIAIDYLAKEPLPAPLVGVTISKDDVTCVELTADLADLIDSDVVDSKGRLTIHLERLDLTEGSYTIDIGIYQQDWAYAYDYHWQAYKFAIEATDLTKGILNVPYSLLAERVTQKEPEQ